MPLDPASSYAAYAARDPRFDGVFFVGVTSTGIYCRPICPARTAKAANCRFFESAEAAEQASFRPCLRCRPELAPGAAPIDDARRVANLLVREIDEGLLDGGGGLERAARRFGWSSRQIRRMVRQELGVSPIELVLTRRLLLAKQLLTETMLPMSEVASASGFASVRRFNDAFDKQYGMPPTRLRQSVAAGGGGQPDSLTLQLTYRPPFEWAGLLAFLRARALHGVELVTEHEYSRTVQLGARIGWVRARNVPAKRSLLVELPHALVPVLPVLLGRLRDLFDLTARPDLIAERLRGSPGGGVLTRAVDANPGLRVPGAFDGFELAVRAILGQQITVKGATTLAARLADAFGASVATPFAELVRLTPTAERIAAASVDDVSAIGLPRVRAASIVALANEVANGALLLAPGAPLDETIARLTAIHGIGPWTAQYIAMRALHWPDAFPKEDAIVRKRLGGGTSAQLEEQSQVWRPWRSYAVLHLWQSSNEVLTQSDE